MADGYSSALAALISGDIETNLAPHLAKTLEVDVEAVVDALKSYSQQKPAAKKTPAKKTEEKKKAEEKHTCEYVINSKTGPPRKCDQKATECVDGVWYCGTKTDDGPTKHLKSALAAQKKKAETKKPAAKAAKEPVVAAVKKAKSISAQFVKGHWIDPKTRIVFKEQNASVVIGQLSDDGKLQKLSSDNERFAEAHGLTIEPFKASSKTPAKPAAATKKTPAKKKPEPEPEEEEEAPAEEEEEAPAEEEEAAEEEEVTLGDEDVADDGEEVAGEDQEVEEEEAAEDEEVAEDDS